MKTIISEKRLRAMLEKKLRESNDLQLLSIQQQLAKKEPETAVGGADASTYYCKTSLSPGSPVTAFPVQSTDYILEFLNSLGSGGTEIGDAFETITNDSASLNTQILNAFDIVGGKLNIINSNNIDNNSPFSDLLVGVADNNPDNFPMPIKGLVSSVGDIKLTNSTNPTVLPTVDASSFYLVSLKATAANKGKSGFYDPVGNSAIHPHTIPQALLGLTKKIKESAPTSSGTTNYKNAAANIGSPPVFDEEGIQTGGGIHNSRYKMKYRIGALTCEPAALIKDGIVLPINPTQDDIDNYLKNTFVGAKIVGSFLPDVLETVLDYSKLDASDKDRKAYAEEVLQPQVDSFNELSQIIVKNIFALYQTQGPTNLAEHKTAMKYVRDNIINSLAAPVGATGVAGYTTPEARGRFLEHSQLIASMTRYVEFITADSKFPYVPATTTPPKTFMGAAFDSAKLMKSNKAFVAADGSIRSKTAWERYLDGFNLIRSYFGGARSPLTSLTGSEEGALTKLSLRSTQETSLNLVRENFEFYLVYKSLYEYASIATSSDTTASASFLQNLGLRASKPNFQDAIRRMKDIKTSTDTAMTTISGDIQAIKNSLKELGAVIAQAIRKVFNDGYPNKTVSGLKNVIVNGINGLISQIKDFAEDDSESLDESFIRDVISAGQSLISFISFLRKTINMVNEQDFNLTAYNSMVNNLDISVSPEIERRITAGINSLIETIRSNLNLQEDRKLYNNIIKDIMEAAKKKNKSVKRK